MAGEYRWDKVPEILDRRRGRLIRKLGGRCVRCGSREDLEFHHPHGKPWRARLLSRFQRLARYEQDAANGNLELLCKDCHDQPDEHPDYCFCPFCRWADL